MQFGKILLLFFFISFFSMAFGCGASQGSIDIVEPISASGNLITFAVTITNNQCVGNFTSFDVFVDGKYDGLYNLLVMPQKSVTSPLIYWDELVQSGSHTLKVCIDGTSICDIKSFTASAIVTNPDECTSNSDCGNYEVCSTGKCVEVECKKDSQCGSDKYIGSKFCSSGSLYQEYKEYDCKNSGTINAYCDNDVSDKLVDSCGGNGCENNQCKVASPPACSTSAGWKCKDASNKAYQYSDCSWGSSTYCSNGCSNGECKAAPSPIKCSSNSDCGTAGYTGSKFCKNGNVYQKYKSPKCFDKGTVNSQCKTLIWDQKTETCVNGCTNGKCNAAPKPPVCSSNADCGKTGYIGTAFCQSGDVYQQYEKNVCKNPGTPEAYCTNEKSNKIINGCDYGCSNGTCTLPLGGWTCKSGDIKAMQTVDGTLTPIEEFCPSGCLNGNCIIECNSDNDCGVTKSVGLSYCDTKHSNLVLQGVETPKCYNKGTKDSYCSGMSTTTVIKTCISPESCVGGTCSSNLCHNGIAPGSDNYCSAACPCGIGEGHCDTNSDCKAGLSCTSGIGTFYGLSSANVCLQPVSFNKSFKLDKGIPGLLVVGAIDGTLINEFVDATHRVVAYADYPHSVGGAAKYFNSPGMKNQIFHWNVHFKSILQSGEEIVLNDLHIIPTYENYKVKYYVYDSVTNEGKIASSIPELKTIIKGWKYSSSVSESIWSKVWAVTKIGSTSFSKAFNLITTLPVLDTIIVIPGVAQLVTPPVEPSCLNSFNACTTGIIDCVKNWLCCTGVLNSCVLNGA